MAGKKDDSRIAEGFSGAERWMLDKVQASRRVVGVLTKHPWQRELIDALAKGGDPRSIMRLIRRIFVDLCGFDRAGVFEFDATTELLRGAWGTDNLGNEDDISAYRFGIREAEREAWQASLQNGHGYVVNHFGPGGPPSDYPPEMEGVQDQGLFFLGTADELIGYVSVDNRMSARPIDESTVASLLPLAEYASLVLLISQMRAKREEIVRQQSRIMEITLAITANEDPEKVYLMVRNAILEIGSVDRAAVWVIEDGNARGTWGTDEAGNLRDEHELSFSVGIDERLLRAFADPDLHYDINCIAIGAEEQVIEVPHAFIPLRASSEIIGFVSVDTLISKNRITPAMLDTILPIADQAAAAIQKSKLLARQTTIVRQQMRLMEISAAIAANEHQDAVFRMVRDAILETGMFDRVGVWFVDGDTARGAWGTDLNGRPIDEHDQHFHLGALLEEFEDCLLGDDPYAIRHEFTTYVNGVELRRNVPYALVPLKVGSRVMGILSADNFRTARKFTALDMEMILPMAKQAAIALLNNTLRAEREDVIHRQKLLMDIAAMVTSSDDSDSVLRMVREALVESTLVDRAGLWLVDGMTAFGTWGTDERGELLDEHAWSFSLEEVEGEERGALFGTQLFVINQSGTAYLTNGKTEDNVPLAIIPLRASGALIGLLTVDNLITKRQLSPANVEMMLPLAKQAAIAIQNRRLLAAAQQEIERRREVEALLIGQTHELAAARDEALAGARVKSEFLANMSHEIRTPMNGVLGMVSNLLEMPIAAQQLEYLRSIQRSGESLMSVIDDILDFSRLEAGMLEIGRYPFNLRDCIEDTVEIVAAQSKQNGVELNVFVPVELPTELVGDGDRLRQMITNLLGNAVKFTEKGEVTVVAEELERTKDHIVVRISVTDTGIGIAEGRRKAIFESFTQADGSLTRRFGGSGLGLTITKQIVELMGGVIGLESVLGEGSTFWIEVPFHKQQTEPEASTTDASLTGTSILIVVKNAKMRGFLAHYAKSWGCEPSIAESEAEAFKVSLDQVHGKTFDFILIDGLFGESEAVTLLDALKATAAVRPAHAILFDSTGGQCQVWDSYPEKFEASLNRPVRQMQFRDVLTALHLGEQSKSFSATARSSSDTSLGYRILLAEDNLVNAMVAGGRLEMWGCTCVVAENGVEAVNAFRSDVFDLVLMDVSMPVMDGMEATRRLREIEEETGRHVPVIAMTAHAMQGDREMCLAAGMDDYVSKPISFDDLLTKVKRWGRRIT